MIRLTGAALQWWCIAFGYYAVFSWAGSLKRRDAPTFRLIWGSKAFLATILGYGTVAFMSYASSAFAPVYALEVLGEDAGTVGLWVGGLGALAGFLGVILESDGRRVGKGCVCTCRFRWSRYHVKTKN